MTRNAKIAFLAALIVIGVASAGWFYAFQLGGTSKERLTQRAFPQRPLTTLILPAAGSLSGVKSGRAKHWPDGFTRKEVSLEYENGMEEFQFFNQNGKRTTSLQYYAAEAGGGRHQRSVATFAADGVTYLSHQIWRQDGSLERAGATLPGGEYEQKYYHAGGTIVSRKRVFTGGDKRLKSEEIFDQKGFRIAAINYRVTNFGINQDVNIFEGGRRKAHFVKNILEEKGEVFGPDGTSVIAQYIKDIAMSEEVYIALDGRVIQTRLSLRFGGSETVRFSSPTRPDITYRQVWRISPTSGRGGFGTGAPAGRMLRTVEEFSSGKSLYTARVAIDGLNAEAITYELPGGMAIVKSVAADGRVFRVTERDSMGKEITSVQPSRPEFVKLPAEMLVDPPHAALPDFRDDSAPPPLYDYP
ncbi:MAG: hypothetical protein C0469_00285 [Cyanobacteria bacterium DS2.3.42]|nr:hypothetical protein [Cyanobacteria bacterium DS2.3.42]